MLAIVKFRNADDEHDYMKILVEFSSAIYREAVIMQRIKTENISSLLTPSDEAFILLLIVVYYEEYADTNYAKDYEGKTFIETTGWQEAGIDLYNVLYRKVKDDRAVNGEQFDAAFRSYYDSLNDGLQLKKKYRGKRNIPVAFNDLD